MNTLYFRYVIMGKRTVDSIPVSRRDAVKEMLIKNGFTTSSYHLHNKSPRHKSVDLKYTNRYEIILTLAAMLERLPKAPMFAALVLFLFCDFRIYFIYIFKA